jgi:hypothetical protein
VPVPGLFMSPVNYADVLKDAGEIGAFDPEKASPLAAIARTRAGAVDSRSAG